MKVERVQLFQNLSDADEIVTVFIRRLLDWIGVTAATFSSFFGPANEGPNTNDDS
ncbi:MAG: hypothetical protein AAF657_41755 [Acidobacteriota bacterium]